jgi:hypothetical protein
MALAQMFTWWDFIKTLLTAAAGLLGVWYGQRNIARKDAKQAAKEDKLAAHERAYVASVIIEQLERYINACIDIAYDDGTACGQPAGGDGFYQSTTKLPEFDPHKLEVNWRALPPDLIYDILEIRTLQGNILRNLDGPAFDDPPEFSDFFWTRRLQFAKLGQQVAEIARRLRKAAGLPNAITEGDWSRDKSFAEVIEKLEAYERQTTQQMPMPLPLIL